MTAAGFVVAEGQCPVETWGDADTATVTWRTLISGERTPTRALTMGVAEVREDDLADFRLHRHAQDETYFVLSGEGVLVIDGVEHALATGAAAFIPGGAWHAARCVGAATLRILYVFAADSFDQVAYEFEDV